MKAKRFFLPSDMKLGLSLIIVLMVISSPVVILVNPDLIAAAAQQRSSGHDYSAIAPSTISQGGSDFTAQAPLLGPATLDRLTL